MIENREPEINPHVCSHVIFPKTIQWGKDNVRNKWFKLDPYLPPHTNITSRWIKGINV